VHTWNDAATQASCRPVASRSDSVAAHCPACSTCKGRLTSPLKVSVSGQSCRTCAATAAAHAALKNAELAMPQLGHSARARGWGTHIWCPGGGVGGPVVGRWPAPDATLTITVVTSRW
jgi:hypothetical protein